VRFASRKRRHSGPACRHEIEELLRTTCSGAFASVTTRAPKEKEKSKDAKLLLEEKGRDQFAQLSTYAMAAKA